VKITTHEYVSIVKTNTISAARYATLTEEEMV